MDRKKFLKLISIGAVSGGVIASLEGCAASYQYVDSVHEGDVLKVPVESFAEEPFALLRNPAGRSPIYVARKDDTYIALLLECTHRQCSVNPVGDSFACPCHGSEFDSRGAVITGPARYPLTEYRVSVNENMVHIHLNN